MWTTSMNWFRVISRVYCGVKNCKVQKGFYSTLPFMEERRYKKMYRHLFVQCKRNTERINQKLRERLT